MKGMETMPKMEHEPSMNVDSSHVENLGDFEDGDRVEMKMMGTMMNKKMMEGGKCSATIGKMSDISMHDEDSKEAAKRDMSRKDYKEVMKGRKKGGE